MMNLLMDADVRCIDGAAGHLAAVVLNPVTKRVTHVVVKTKGLLAEEYLAPLNVITETTAKHIVLRCSREELATFEPFIKMVAISPGGVGPGLEGIAHVEFTGAFAPTDFPYWESAKTATIPEENTPDAEIAVRTDTAVHAADGPFGNVDGFFVDAESGEIMQLVLRAGHLWGKKEIAIALDQIDRIGEDAVYLALSKHAIEQLPQV